MAKVSGTKHSHGGSHKPAKRKAIPSAKGNKYPPNGIHKATGKS